MRESRRDFRPSQAQAPERMEQDPSGPSADLRASGPYPGRDFDDALLAALAGMAVKSPRRQADLFVAARRFGLTAAQDHLRVALTHLQADGCVDRVVPLEDGGVLVSITNRGIERLSHSAMRHMVERI